MKKRTIKILSLITVLVLLLGMILPVANAVDLTQTTGSLRIVKYEVNNNTQSLLSGVTFAIYKIDDDSESIEIPNGQSPVATLTTGDDGTVTFSNLELGRYLVVEVSAPANVVSKIANFIVDIPMTDSDGDDLIYDVTVYPKNNTVYGGIVLTKYGNDTETLEDVEFELQVKDDDDNWSRYESDTYTSTTVLATDENGTITLEGLPAGTYRFVETLTLDGYILDNNTTYEFVVSLNSNGNTEVSPETISVYNPKPTITKEVVNPTSDYSYSTGDTVSFKITTDVPSTIAKMNTYTITDVIPTGLTYTSGTLKVYGDSVELSAGEDYTFDESSWTITFVGSELASCSSVIVTYDTTLNSSADATSTGNINTATLTYSTIVSTDYNGSSNAETISTVSDSATVYTGGFWIEKRAKSTSGDLLKGAVFKLAATESDAKAGTYMKDENGDEITLTTGDDGTVSYSGLAYGTYYLVEVQAPSYDDNGETKYYNLLTEPVTIVVTADTYSSSSATAVVINKTGFTLPVTGGVGVAIIIVVGVALIGTGVIVYRKGGKKEN